MRIRLLVLLAGACLFPASLTAQEKQPDDGKGKEAVHEELRAFRKSLTEAVEKGDLERQLDHVHPDVVVTWQNGEVVRGQQELRDFYQRNVAQQGIFQGYREPPMPTELTILHDDDTGISYGTSVAHYKLLGMEFDLRNHWTATVVRENGDWKIASYHVSANVLDNPVLNAAKTWLYWIGGIALVVGLLVGFLLGRAAAGPRRPGP